MPAYYNVVPGATITTNAVANTENDCLFIKPGTRNLWIRSIKLTGRAVSATSVSGITLRLKKWTTTASSGGTAVTPSPTDPGFQAAKHSAGFSAATVTSGTGGPTLLDSIGVSKTGFTPWVTPQQNLDDATMLEGSATQSMDLFNISGDTSLVFEPSLGTAE